MLDRPSAEIIPFRTHSSPQSELGALQLVGCCLPFFTQSSNCGRRLGLRYQVGQPPPSYGMGVGSSCWLEPHYRSGLKYSCESVSTLRGTVSSVNPRHGSR